MRHEIPEDVTNSRLELLIDEYVRYRRDREILKEHWFGGLSFMALAEKHDMSLTAIKDIIYRQGDKVLMRAEKREPD